MIPHKPAVTETITSATTMSACGAGCVLAFLNSNAAAILVVVAIVSLLINIYFKKKHLNIEQEKLRQIFKKGEN